MTKYHQFYRAFDGSECIRNVAGDPWTMLKGDRNSDAYKFMKVQNRFWKSWVRKAIQLRNKS